MDVARISADDLWLHWRENASLKSGERIVHTPAHHLPPWQELCDRLDWSTYLLSKSPLKTKTHGYRGVYRIISLVSGDKSNPETINRARGQDATGTIYIGESMRLNKRFNQLRLALFKRGQAHSAAYTLRFFPTWMYSPNTLAVSLLKTGKKYKIYRT